MPTYTVKLADGTSQTFTSPADLSDVEAYQRAVQEQGFASGHIPTSFAGGMTKAALEDPSVTGPILTGAGMLSGTTPLVAGGMALADIIKAAVQKGTGDPVTVNPMDVALHGAEGTAMAYGPGIVAKGLSRAAATTVPHQLPDGRWVKGLTGTGILPWATREGLPAASDAANSTLGRITPEATGNTVKDLLRKILGMGQPPPTGGLGPTMPSAGGPTMPSNP